MPNEYTRQRQGRDFSIADRLRGGETRAGRGRGDMTGAAGGGDPKDEWEKKKSLLEQLEQHKAESERNAAPIDGHEPPERGR